MQLACEVERLGVQQQQVTALDAQASEGCSRFVMGSSKCVEQPKHMHMYSLTCGNVGNSCAAVLQS
jgi:hypothetical protein